MNAYCTSCHKRTDHRRTQFGSWFRFFCMICGNELRENRYGVPGPAPRLDLPLDTEQPAYPPRGS